MRKCKMVRNGEPEDMIFHQFGLEEDGEINYTVAIVEYMDGRVFTCPPSWIIFDAEESEQLVEIEPNMIEISYRIKSLEEHLLEELNKEVIGRFLDKFSKRRYKI